MLIGTPLNPLQIKIEFYECSLVRAITTNLMKGSSGSYFTYAVWQ